MMIGSSASVFGQRAARRCSGTHLPWPADVPKSDEEVVGHHVARCETQERRRTSPAAATHQPRAARLKLRRRVFGGGSMFTHWCMVCGR